jgi:hypothetical protein
MGVMGTFCQICAMPVQHNGYVPYRGMYYIYRGPKSIKMPDDPGPPFNFGPEHDWLLDAIALRLNPDEEPQILAGEVQDHSCVERSSKNLITEEAITLPNQHLCGSASLRENPDQPKPLSPPPFHPLPSPPTHQHSFQIASG